MKFADFDYDLKILKGTLEKKSEILFSLNGQALQVAVVNYESVWRLDAEIKKWHPDMIICDESCKIKNHAIRLPAKSKEEIIVTKRGN